MSKPKQGPDLVYRMAIDKVTVAPYEYEVRYDDNLSASASVLGLCMADSLIILLDPTSAPAIMHETLLHEVLHAAWTQTALDGIYTDEQEEQIIFTLTPRIVAFLKDNPHYVEGLYERRKIESPADGADRGDGAGRSTRDTIYRIPPG